MQRLLRDCVYYNSIIERSKAALRAQGIGGLVAGGEAGTGLELELAAAKSRGGDSAEVDDDRCNGAAGVMDATQGTRLLGWGWIWNNTWRTLPAAPSHNAHYPTIPTRQRLARAPDDSSGPGRSTVNDSGTVDILYHGLQ